MATPFLVGLGVAGAAMAAKHGLKVAESLASNPEAMKTMGAAGAGFVCWRFVMMDASRARCLSHSGDGDVRMAQDAAASRDFMAPD